jgi:hypothetical protein
MHRADGEKIGTIRRLMIDKLSGSVAYAVLSFGGFLGWDKSTRRSLGAPELRPYARRLPS